MKNKRILISEQEKNRILNLYGLNLISEQDESVNEKIDVNFGANWPVGKWRLTQEQLTQIQPKLQQILDFIVRYKESKGERKVTIQVASSESATKSNQDNEVSPPVPLQAGELARRRGNELVKYLKEWFASQIGTTLSEEDVPFIPAAKAFIGKTAAASEQNVKATVKLAYSYECIVGMEVTVGYFTKAGIAGNAGTSPAGHTCDAAIFDLKMNGVVLGTVNLNNADLDVNGRGAREKDEMDIFKEIGEGKRGLDGYFAHNFQIYYNKYKDKYPALFPSKNTYEFKDAKFLNYKNNALIKPAYDFYNMMFESNYTQLSRVNYLINQFKKKHNMYANVSNGELAQKIYWKYFGKDLGDVNALNAKYNESGRQTDKVVGGNRWQTFKITAEIAKNIVQQTKSGNIELSMSANMPAIKQYGFDQAHSDVPYVIIRDTKDNSYLFNASAPVSGVNKSGGNTVLLTTDLCGNPLGGAE